MVLKENEFYSNCLLEALKAKVKYGKEVKIIHVRSNDGLHHFLWHDLYDGNIYDFQQLETVTSWFDLFWFKGKIRVRPYCVYERWLEEEEW